MFSIKISLSSHFNEKPPLNFSNFLFFEFIQIDHPKNYEDFLFFSFKIEEEIRLHPSFSVIPFINLSSNLSKFLPVFAETFICKAPCLVAKASASSLITFRLLSTSNFIPTMNSIVSGLMFFINLNPIRQIIKSHSILNITSNNYNHNWL